MFYEGLLEALPAQSPLRWRVNRSWYPYGILKKGHNILDHDAIFAVLTLDQACELMGPRVENIRRGRLSSNAKSSSGFDQVSEARARRARRVQGRGGRLSTQNSTDSKNAGRSSSRSQRVSGQLVYDLLDVVRGLGWPLWTFMLVDCCLCSGELLLRYIWALSYLREPGRRIVLVISPFGSGHVLWFPSNTTFSHVLM